MRICFYSCYKVWHFNLVVKEKKNHFGSQPLVVSHGTALLQQQKVKN